ncbi:Hypothetical protein CAP_8481 [Chondromyces apiculatus DSM 436]|uniref:Uncharacterized protein n=1 Tax=Chondromyces apiculatus DSM 436 TaxID=1192034 RepID=A0A017SW65_9BACT|nr:Hypothetical protein CAP_8481 [Chondromyces apiculatus DSM 436]
MAITTPGLAITTPGLAITTPGLAITAVHLARAARVPIDTARGQVVRRCAGACHWR